MIVTTKDLERATAAAECWFGDADPYDYQRAVVAAIVEDWFSSPAPIMGDDGRPIFTIYAQLKADVGAGKTRMCMAIAYLLCRFDLHFVPPGTATPDVVYCGNVPVECLREDKNSPVIVLAPPGGALQNQWKQQLKRFGGSLRVETPSRRAQFPGIAKAVVEGQVDVIVLRRTMSADYEAARAAAGAPPARLIITDDAPVEAVGPSKRILGRAWLTVSATLDLGTGTTLFEVPDDWVRRSVDVPDPVRTRRRFREDPNEAQIKGAVSPEVQELVSLGNLSEACRVLGIRGEISMERLIAKALADERERVRDLAAAANKIAVRLETRYGTAAAAPERERDRLAAAQQRAAGAREGLESRIRNLEAAKEECPVCGDEGALVVTPCAHGICEECYLQWAGTRRKKKFRCPQCNVEFPHSECTRLVTAVEDADGNLTRLPTRLQLLEAVVSGLPAGARPLIFLGGESGARTVANRFGYRVGNCPSAVAQFQEGKAAGLVMDAKTRAEGLELQCATHLIIAAEIEKATVYQQIVGRCQRVGRAAPLQLVEFACAD